MLFVCVCVCLTVHITLGCGEGLSSAHPASLQPDRLLCYGKPLITPSRREALPSPGNNGGGGGGQIQCTLLIT